MWDAYGELQDGQKLFEKLRHGMLDMVGGCQMATDDLGSGTSKWSRSLGNGRQQRDIFWNSQGIEISQFDPQTECAIAFPSSGEGGTLCKAGFAECVDPVSSQEPWPHNLHV